MLCLCIFIRKKKTFVPSKLNMNFNCTSCTHCQNTADDVITSKRELKWIKMMDNWDHYRVPKNNMKVIARCREGIPPSVRSRAWQLLSGGAKLMAQNPGKYDDLISRPGNSECLEQIRLDLDRTFPGHEMFEDSSSPGQVGLFKVLKAYSIYNPVDGYAQEYACVAGILIIHMPAEESFWCLVAILQQQQYLAGYHSEGSEAFQIDWDTLVHLLKKVSPLVYDHMMKQPEYSDLYRNWFAFIYIRTLPWPSVLRVWDMFLSEGVCILFKVGMVLLKDTLSKTITESTTLEETIDLLKHLPISVTNENVLVLKILKLRISAVKIGQVRKKLRDGKKAATTAL